MPKKPKELKPGYEKIVKDFDKWLNENIPSLMDKDSITVIKEIHNKWMSYKHEYIKDILKRYDDLIKEYHIKKKGDK